MPALNVFLDQFVISPIVSKHKKNYSRVCYEGRKEREQVKHIHHVCGQETVRFIHCQSET